MQKPDNNLAWSILTTVLCCMPLGIVAILKSNKVDTLWAQGAQDEAIKAANDAKKFCIIGVIASAIFWVLYFILYGGLIAFLIANDAY